MRILIVGGSGLISTYLTRQAVEAGHEVVIANRGKSKFAAPDGARVVLVDRTQRESFEQTLVDLGQFDALVDMIGFTPDDAESTARVAAKTTGHLIFCSTVDVYDKPPARYPVSPNAPLGGASGYAQNKTKCEAILTERGAQLGFAVTHLRPAYTYGEGASVLHSLGFGTGFLDRLKRGLPVVVHGDGQSLWPSCHGSDVARAFLAAIGNRETHGRSYTLAAFEWLTWRDHYRAVARSIGAPQPNFVEIPSVLLHEFVRGLGWGPFENFQYNNIFDQAASQQDLGFEQTISWEEGAGRMVQWLEAHGELRRAEEEPEYQRVLDAWESARSAFGEAMAEPA